MYSNIFRLIPLFLLLLVSCSKNINRNTTFISFTNPGYVTGLSSSRVALGGGVVISGYSNEGDFFTIPIDSDSETVNLEVNNGTWHFAAVGWAGSSATADAPDIDLGNRMEGNLYCSSRVDETLNGNNGNPQSITIDLSQVACDDDFYDPKEVYDNGLPDLEIETCKWIAEPDDLQYSHVCASPEPSPDPTSTVDDQNDYDKVRGWVQSFKVVFPSINPISKSEFKSRMDIWDDESYHSTTDHWPGFIGRGFESDCFVIGASNTNKNTELQIPIFEGNISDDLITGYPFIPLVLTYATDNCTVEECPATGCTEGGSYHFDVYDLAGDDNATHVVTDAGSGTNLWKAFLVDWDEWDWNQEIVSFEDYPVSVTAGTCYSFSVNNDSGYAVRISAIYENGTPTLDTNEIQFYTTSSACSTSTDGSDYIWANSSETLYHKILSFTGSFYLSGTFFYGGSSSQTVQSNLISVD